MLPSPLLPSSGVSPSPGQCDSWTVTSLDRAAYENLFHETAASVSPTGEKLLGAQEAREFFTQSGLPAVSLAAIWNLADMDRDGSLDREEFVIAMHLCRRARKAVPIPDVLPRELVPASKSLYYNVTADAGNWTVLGTATPAATATTTRRSSGGQSQMPHYALPGATFEQRIQLDGELASAIAARRSDH